MSVCVLCVKLLFIDPKLRFVVSLARSFCGPVETKKKKKKKKKEGGGSQHPFSTLTDPIKYLYSHSAGATETQLD